MKKTFAILLALIMVLSLATAASAASITINTNLPAEGTNEGETYNAYKIFDADISGDNYSYTIDSSSPYYETIVDSGYFTLSQINDSTVYAVVANDGVDEDDIKTLAASLKTIADTQTADGSATSSGSANVVIDDLDPGYYLVTSSLGSALIVDTTSDVVINTKNTYPTISKSEDKTTAAYGETVTYTVPVTIPATASGAITLHDTMTNLTYNNDVTASVGGVLYEITAITDGLTDDCSVEFVLSAGVVAANLGKTVIVTYSADVVAGYSEGTNTVQLEYSNYWSPEYTVKVYNYKLDVYKTDGTNGLEGAGFVLKNAEGKYYSKNAEGEIEWVDSIGSALELKPVADTYTVTFDGLANGTYTLVEKTVPAGYTQANDLEIVIQDADKTGENKITVVNKSGTELPETGGVGTTMFYVFGSMMVVGAAVVLVTKKRMTAAE